MVIGVKAVCRQERHRRQEQNGFRHGARAGHHLDRGGGAWWESPGRPFLFPNGGVRLLLYLQAETESQRALRR